MNDIYLTCMEPNMCYNEVLWWDII